MTHAKMACGDRRAAARVALLDPLLTLSMPDGVTRLTGIDAIAHAVESAVCRKSSEISFAYSRAAFAVLALAFPRVLANPQDQRGRAGMLLGSALAGTAIENSMLGAAHSAANPLTAAFGTVHGQAVGMMLPHVVRYNLASPEAAAAYGRLAAIVNLTAPAFPGYLASLLEQAGLPARLAPGLITGENIATLSSQAAGQWTAQFNPIIPGPDAFAGLYAAVM